MSWNAKPGSSALPPPAYPRKRSPFPEQPFRSPLGSTPQSSLTYPGQSPEACAFLGSSDLATQPQLGHPQAQLRNYGAASVQSGAVVTSQTSVQRVTYVSIRPKALDHSVQVSPGLSHGTWLTPALRNPALQHAAAGAMPQSSFGTKAPAMVQTLQSQFVTSDTYSMQLQMVPVSSSRAPESCQGSSRLSPAPLQGFPGPWTQQPHTSSGLACPEYRPPQHTYSSSFLPEPALQKPSPLPARNSLPPGPGLTLPPQQAVPGQTFQCSAAQPDARVASYSYSYTGQPLPSPQHLPKHVAAEPSRSQEPHTPGSRKEFSGSFRPLWLKLPENLSTLGTFCNVKVSNSTGEPFHSPTGASVPSEPFHRPAGASMPGEPFHGPTGASMPGEPFHGLAGAAMPGEPFHGTTGAAMPGEPFHGPAGTAVPGDSFLRPAGTALPREPFHGTTGAAVPGESFLGPAGTAVPREPFHGPTRASLPREPFQGPTRASMPRDSFQGPTGASIPGEPFHGPMRASVPNESFHEPTRVSVPSMQAIVPRRLEKRAAPCTLPPNSALDTNVAKEKLVRDLKTLVEIKNKFSELARKIKINKELLMAAGCIKTTNVPYSDSAPNPELAQKESGGVHSGSLLSLLTSEATENKELDRAGGRPSSPRELGSGLHGPLCPEVLPVSAQGQGQQAQTTSQAAVEGAVAAGSGASCSAGGFASTEESAPAGLEPSAFPPQSPCEAKDKYLHKHPIILRLLEVRDHTTQGKLLKGAPETLQASKPPGPDVKPDDPVPGQLLWRAPEVTGPCNAGTKDTGHALPQDLPSPSGGTQPKGESPCSMELLATCLSLWRNSPVEPAKDMPQEQPATSPAAAGPCSKSGLVAGTSGSRAAPTPQDSAQPGAPQNHEPPGMAVSKGTEPQIAVVTPLVLSSAKALDVKGDAPEMVYPVIKEGSVCSLQSRLAEEAGDHKALKASVAGPVAGPEDTPRLSPAQGGSEDTPRLCLRQQAQAEPAGPLPSDGDKGSGSENRLRIGNICSLLEGTMSYNPQIAEMFSVPECPVGPGQGDSCLAEDREVGPQSQTTVQGAVLSGKSAQCSTPQTPEPAGAPEPEPTSQCPPEPALPQLPAPPRPEPPAPLHPVGGERTAMQASGLGCHVEKAGLAFNLGSVTAAPDTPCEDRAPGSMERGTLEDETPILYLRDQLSELLKEFPYGVAPVKTCEAPASWHLPRRGWKRPRTRKPVSAAAATEDQIQITILNSEQMKSLFSEQDLQEPNTVLEPQKGELVYKEGAPPAAGSEEGGQQGARAQVTEDGSQGDPPALLSEEGHQQAPQAQVSEEGRWGDALVQVTEEGSQGGAQGQVTEEGRQGDAPAQVSEEGRQGDAPAQVSEEVSRADNSAQVIEDRGQGSPTTQAVRAECPESTPVDPQKDDLPCCALGWLSAVYEGVPQCQCSLAQSRRSTKPTKRKSGHPHTSQDTLKRKHREGSLERDGPRHHSPLVVPDRKRPLLGSGKEKDRTKIKPNDPRKMQQALPGQRLHSVPRPTEPVPSQAHPGGGKAPTSEVTILKTSEAARSSQENQPRKQPVPSPQLLKAKVGFLSHKTKELHRSLGPRKLLLKAGVASHKAWDKRKSDDGGALDSAIKKRKVDGPEQSRAEGPAGGAEYSSSRKTWGSVSISKEGGYRKERLGLQVKDVGTVVGSPKARRPESPKAQRPGSSKARRPESSKPRSPVSPKPRSPVSPKAQRPASPKAQRPVSPKAQRPASPKARRPGSPDPTQRHKHKEAAAAKTSRKDPGKARHGDKQVPRHSKSSQAHPRPIGSRPAPEVTRAGASFVKSHQPRTEESKSHSSRTEKQAGEKSRERPWTEKNQSHRLSSSTGPAATPAKDHKKLYLNRVGFQCTERQSICLTQLDPSPRKPHREEKSREGTGPQKEDAGRPGMLEFKLCPESMIPKTGLGDEHALLQPGPQKDQEPAQVSGIRSTKEDWLKCVTEERRPDAARGIDGRVGGNPRLSKRALSADDAVGAQTPPQDIQAMFQTYRKMYMEKRSRSLGSSPLK